MRRPTRRSGVRAAAVLLGLAAVVSVTLVVTAHQTSERVHTITWVAPPTTSSSALSPTAAAPASASGPAGAGEPVVEVVGLGDSVTSGLNCDCDDYVTGLGGMLSRQDHRSVRTVNAGVAGATTPDLTADLSSDITLRRQVASADVVVITIGANDLYPALGRWRAGGCGPSCYAPEVATMGTDVSRLLAAVDALRPAAAPDTVLVTTYWNVFTDGDVARRAESSGYLSWSDAVTGAADTALCRSATQAGARCVDLYTPFKGDGSADPTRWLSDDGDHPNAAGTALISRAVLRALDQSPTPPASPGTGH